jgi:hypothetical protein
MGAFYEAPYRLALKNLFSINGVSLALIANLLSILFLGSLKSDWFS